MRQQHIDNCLEALCSKGCSAVWNHIAMLEAGKNLPETQKLSIAERQEVLLQLKLVMLVYQGSCTIDGS